MRRKRRTHKPEFKAKVALAAPQGDLTMAEIMKKNRCPCRSSDGLEKAVVEQCAGSLWSHDE